MSKKTICLNYKTARHIQDRVYDIRGGGVHGNDEPRFPPLV